MYFTMASPQYKVIVVGADGTGKTAFVSRLLNKAFEPKYIATLCVEVHPLTFGLQETSAIQFNVWDCAGQEELSGQHEGYYIKTDAAIVFVDDGEKWQKYTRDIKRVSANIPIFYVRSKFDIANKKKLQQPTFTDISAKSGYNCQHPFEQIAQHFGHLEAGESFTQSQ